MTGRELVIRKSDGVSIREAAARIVLREARHRGHDYVELREVGRRIVFFCTICLTQCFGDSSLWDHLRGSLHAMRYAAAERTLLGPLRWPFNDGVLFFSGENSTGLLRIEGAEIEVGVESDGSALSPKKGNIVVSNVLAGEKLAELVVRVIGIGHVAASIRQSDKLGKIACRTWCAWLGEGGPEDVNVLSSVPDSDVAIVTLRYNCDLGRRSTTEELSLYLEDGGSPRKRLRKSFSDPEEDSTELGGQCDSEGSSNGSSSVKEDQYEWLRFMSSKAIRRELRRRERLAAERICDICRQRMLPGKDVAALLNLKTGRLACSSRNANGAFHVFHISCLIHWILLCEFEIWSHNKPVKTRGGRGKKGKKALKGHITSIFCPECQGSGANAQAEQLENPTFHLSEMFLYKLKAIQGHRAWMEDPESLPKCSTGLNLSCEEQFQGKVLPSKLLQFYRADI